jgi:NADH:ubiquinone oxidoreductase subunit 2 (subunit N)
MDATALLASTGALLPHMTVLVTGLVILTLDLFLTPRGRYLNEVVGLIGLLVALFFTLGTTGAPRQVFMAMAVVDYLVF